MKKLNRIPGESNSPFLVVVLLCISTFLTANAQVVKSVPAGVDGKQISRLSIIEGEKHPEGGSVYVYRHDFADVAGAYWHIEGAAEVNGVPVAQLSDRQFPASTATVRVRWNTTSIPFGRVQLMRQTGTGADQGQILASRTVYLSAGGSLAVTNKIYTTGQYASGSGGYRTVPFVLCPNAVNPTSGAVASVPYEF